MSYLLDAAITETNAIKLRLLNSDGKIEEVVDQTYRPYFLTSYPLSDADKETTRYFSGEIQFTEKTELFTNQKKTYAKIYWPNPKIAAKATERFTDRWESEIEVSRSYVYDKDLLFGAPHSQNDLKLVTDLPSGMKSKFENTFREIEVKDPQEYAQIAHWFSVLHQPMPKLPLESIDGKASEPERIYAAWMLARIANIPLAQAFTSKHVSEWIKPMLYTYLRRNNILIPTSEELRRGKTPHSVVGALTVAPKAGTYFNTVICDFESLYASCIDSFNLSYETVDCSHAECSSNRIPDLENHVCTKRRGFYSILVGALKELRIRVFKPASKDPSLPEEERRIAAAAAKLLKLILVSSYGVTVRIHGLACPPLAEAITGYGRYVLRESWELADKNGLRPLYGDTDSLFLDNASNEQIEWLIQTVKERFRLDLIVDKRYNLCVLPKAKKAYFGILLDGTPDIKGVTPMKSNSPAFIANVFRQCLKELSTVKNQDEYLSAKQKIREAVSKAVDDLRKRNVKLEDLTYSVRLYFDPNERIAEMKITPQPYQCALQLTNAGKKLNRGDTVSFIKVKPFRHNGRTFTVKPTELVRSLIEINVEDYIRNMLTALHQTFEPMGITLNAEKKAEISKWLAG